MEREDARALLQVTQQLRVHWSGLIVNWTGITIAANVALWSFGVKAYFDSVAGNRPEPLFVYVPLGVSALWIGLWRLVAHHIDDDITALYPELLFYEQVLRVPPRYGTRGFLFRHANEQMGDIIEGERQLTDNDMVQIRGRVAAHQIGDRGHWLQNFFAALSIVLLGLLAFVVATPANWAVPVVAYVAYFVSFVVLALIGRHLARTWDGRQLARFLNWARGRARWMDQRT